MEVKRTMLPSPQRGLRKESMSIKMRSHDHEINLFICKKGFWGAVVADSGVVNRAVGVGFWGSCCGWSVLGGCGALEDCGDIVFGD